jgi:hypothetical protein
MLPELLPGGLNGPQRTSNGLTRGGKNGGLKAHTFAGPRAPPGICGAADPRAFLPRAAGSSPSTGLVFRV